MAVNAANLILGPCRFYVAAFGAAEPADSTVTPNGVTTPPSAPWVDAGGTDGGVTFEVDTTYTKLSVDQIIMNVGARLTDLEMSVKAKLAESTLTNLNNSLNSIAVQGSGSGFANLEVAVQSAASQPAYAALLIDGWAPYLSSGAPALRRIIVRKVVSETKATLVYDKKTQTGYDCTWMAYYVSSSINPCHIVDQTA